MTINDIYELSLYLAEKTDDDTGFIDSEYKNKPLPEFTVK